MSNFVRQCQLRHFRWHSAVVVHERDDARIQRPLRGLIRSVYRLRVRLVFLADAARSS